MAGPNIRPGSRAQRLNHPSSQNIGNHKFDPGSDDDFMNESLDDEEEKLDHMEQVQRAMAREKAQAQKQRERMMAQPQIIDKKEKFNPMLQSNPL